MNSIEILEQEIHNALPGVDVTLRRPRNPKGNWWLDAKSGEHVVTVQWSPRRGFGVNANDLAGYGEGPDEVFEDRESAATRVIALLRTRAPTIPPREVLLRELRALVGFTQDELAAKLGVQQAAVSRLERRSDITLGSLRRYVAALGGELEISIRTPGGDHVRLLEPTPNTRRASCEHVERSLPSASSSREAPSDAELSSWLSAFECRARARWAFPSTAVTIRAACTQALASSDPLRGSVAINTSTATRLADALEQIAQHAGGFRELRLQTSRAAFRYLLAHEVGHFVEDPSRDLQFNHPELKADAIAGWLAAQQGEDAMLGAAIASLLGCRDRGCTHPPPESRSFAYLSGHSLGLHERTSSATMNLVVVRAGDVERSRTFYALLGLQLVPEKHETGPLHYSCRMADTVLEIYPCGKNHTKGGLRLGIQLARESMAIEALLSSGFLAERPGALRRGSRTSTYLVKDPDDNMIELELPEAA